MTLQSDPGWLVARRGFATASRADDILNYRKDGKEGAERRKYKIELVAERIADHAVDHYVSPAMQRGLDLEPWAREAYEAQTGNLVAPAAFILHPRIEYMGATPDGFIGHDGLLEIKVPLVHNYVELVQGGVIQEQYHAQLLFQLACTGRRWTDFVAYCPEMPEAHQLFIRRFEPDAEAIANMEAATAAFLAEVDAMFTAFVETPIAA